jgi:hypothetical protein
MCRRSSRKAEYEVDDAGAVRESKSAGELKLSWSRDVPDTLASPSIAVVARKSSAPSAEVGINAGVAEDVAVATLAWLFSWELQGSSGFVKVALLPIEDVLTT